MSKNWPMVPLGDILRPAGDSHPVKADCSYPNFGIYSFGRGLFFKPPISGLSTSARTLYRTRKGQFIYSRLFAFEGAYGLVTEEFDGYFVSNEYPMFDCVADRIIPDFLGLYFKAPRVWEKIAHLSTGMGDRRRRIQPEQLLSHLIPLPAIEEQRKVVAWIADLRNKSQEVNILQKEILDDNVNLLNSVYQQIIRDVDRRPLSEVAPLTRRPVSIDRNGIYPQIAVRSFGKGTFHQPPLRGSDITWQKPYRVEIGDILISNIKAWEGAVAIVNVEDEGRYGSHRYLLTPAWTMRLTA